MYIYKYQAESFIDKNNGEIGYSVKGYCNGSFVENYGNFSNRDNAIERLKELHEAQEKRLAIREKALAHEPEIITVEDL